MRIFSLSSIYLLVGVGLGVSSAVNSLNSTGLKPVAEGNGWRAWQLNSSDRLQPYALGHFLNLGQVPPPASALYYVRSLDDDGNELRGDCAVVIEGPAATSRWWTLSAGQTEAATLSAGEAFLNADRNLSVTVSQHPISGNWIVPPGSGAYVLTYVISEQTKAEGVKLSLPHVKKLSC
jgi:hypothetical protein